MTLCFENNVFCCYLPAHCSYGLQPLDNGVFNALKLYYHESLSTWQSLTDSSPVDKINFIKCLAEARTQAITEKNIKSAFRTTRIGQLAVLRRCHTQKSNQIRRNVVPSPPSQKIMILSSLGVISQISRAPTLRLEIVGNSGELALHLTQRKPSWPSRSNAFVSSRLKLSV